MVKTLSIRETLRVPLLPENGLGLKAQRELRPRRKPKVNKNGVAEKKNLKESKRHRRRAKRRKGRNGKRTTGRGGGVGGGVWG